MAQYGSLTKKQKTILDNHNCFSWDDLPQDVQDSVLSLRDHETTWSDAERYLGDNYNRRTYERRAAAVCKALGIDP